MKMLFLLESKGKNEDSMDNLAIRVEDVCKVYKLYDKPSDRLKDALGLVRKNHFKEHHALKHVSFEVKKVRRSASSERMVPENLPF